MQVMLLLTDMLPSHRSASEKLNLNPAPNYGEKSDSRVWSQEFKFVCKELGQLSLAQASCSAGRLCCLQ